MKQRTRAYLLFALMVGTALLSLCTLSALSGPTLACQLGSTAIACAQAVGGFAIFRLLCNSGKRSRERNVASKDRHASRFGDSRRMLAAGVLGIGLMLGLFTAIVAGFEATGGIGATIVSPGRDAALFQGSHVRSGPILLLAGFALLCALTAVFEELLFRGLVFPGIVVFMGSSPSEVSLSRKDERGIDDAPCASGGAYAATAPLDSLPACPAVLEAALLSSIVFGTLHMSSAQVLADPDVVSCAQMLAKALQAFLFGLVMCALVCGGRQARDGLSFASDEEAAHRRDGSCTFDTRFASLRSLALPMAVHAGFNVLSQTPLVVMTGAIPQTHITGCASDLVILGASIVALTPLAVKAARMLRRA